MITTIKKKRKKKRHVLHLLVVSRLRTLISAAIESLNLPPIKSRRIRIPIKANFIIRDEQKGREKAM